MEVILEDPDVSFNCAENWMLYVPAFAMTIRDVGVPRDTPNPTISSVLNVHAAPAVAVEIVCVVLSEKTPR
jgi:hypothetical protein